MSLPSFPKFDVFTEESSLGVRWDKYVTKLENLFTGLNITSKKRKKALLLHYAGDDVFNIYDTFDLSGDEENYDDTKTELKTIFNPRKNTEFERYEFRNINQNHCESIDQYATRLRQKAEYCEFHDKEAEIKSQLIQGCSSERLRRKCLEADKPLTELLIMARTLDISAKQAKSMQNVPEVLIKFIENNF